MQDRFGEVMVPTEEVVEMRSGQKRRSERKFFPGYVLVQIATHDESGIPRMDNESWHLVKETPKVMGFIGGTADRPLPIRDEEAAAILDRVRKAWRSPSPRCCSNRARWCASPTARSTTSTAWSRKSTTKKSRLRVAVLIFGRSTPVELNSARSRRKPTKTDKGRPGLHQKESPAVRENVQTLELQESMQWQRKSSVTSSCR